MQDNKALILAHSVKVFVKARCPSSVRPQFAKIAIGTSISSSINAVVCLSVCLSSVCRL